MAKRKGDGDDERQISRGSSFGMPGGNEEGLGRQSLKGVPYQEALEGAVNHVI